MENDPSPQPSNRFDESKSSRLHELPGTLYHLDAIAKPLIPTAPSEESTSPDRYSQSLSDRLTQLAGATWAAEQDGNIQSRQQRRLLGLIQNFEMIVENMDDSESDDELSIASAGQEQPASSLSNTLVEEKELEAVHTALANTVASMRLRQQEQRHLHQLTVRRLESVAQECLIQQNELNKVHEEVDSLRVENRALGEENDRLRHRIIGLEDEAARNQFAVDAMSSAVKGLEGYLESADRSSPVRQDTMTPRRERRVVYRGKGRFRGRYYVQDDLPTTPDMGLDGTVDSQELQDGVKAWLRGFRDVEEELRYSGRDGAVSKERASIPFVPEDEWGDFQSPSVN